MQSSAAQPRTVRLVGGPLDGELRALPDHRSTFFISRLPSPQDYPMIPLSPGQIAPRSLPHGAYRSGLFDPDTMFWQGWDDDPLVV